jgi:uncharacterized protein (DUF885 family)
MPMRHLVCSRLLLAAAALAAGAGAAVAAPAPPHVPADVVKQLQDFIAARGQSAASERERLNQLFDISWRYTMEVAPEFATQIGYPGRNDRWSDISPAAIAEQKAMVPRFLAALDTIDRAKLPPPDQLNYDLGRRGLASAAEGGRFPGELLPINQMGGVQQFVPDLLSVAPARNVDDYDDLLARLRGVPRLVDQTIALLERGLAQGITPPRITLRDVPGQVASLLVDDPLTSPMLKAFTKFPDAIPEPERARLRREAAAAYEQMVKPAYRKLHDYVETAYLPHSRETLAMSALPDGAAWYAFRVRQETTTALSPRQIHDIGLAEVKRIRKEMDELIARIGFKGSFADFQRFLRTDPRFFYERPDDLLAGYRDICKRIDPELIRFFGRLPRLPYGVLPVPAYSEKSQTTAYYNGGSLAGARAGTFFANTYDLKSRPKWEMEALTLHEAVPGHHLQLSLAEEMENVPEWRRYDTYTAFVEGWGLYAESLGPEIGLYKDPYSQFGQLTYQIWRAIRLVVDTGIHSMGWSRQQAIDYFAANAAKTEHDVTVEVDRYIVWPGQALAYKIGELKLRELRAMAEKDLGPSFDVRAFHDALLGNGALPLDVLETGMKSWVEARKQAAAGARDAIRATHDDATKGAAPR